jgi:hypothetical protein
MIKIIQHCFVCVRRRGEIRAVKTKWTAYEDEISERASNVTLHVHFPSSLSRQTNIMMKIFQAI